ncbi:MAG: twin-arginine translocation pathway signal protein [Polaromonas sp.]|nr:twin-arginine translocation pathway signal protein [Polaromonas sp.]
MSQLDTSANSAANSPHASRRGFLVRTGATVAGVAAGVIGPVLGEDAGLGAAQAQTPPGADAAFRQQAYDIRVAAARANLALPIPPHPTNGDEQRYANKIGSDTRGLPHNPRGEVDPAAFKAAVAAYTSGKPEDFEKIPLGGTRKQLNPIGSLAVSLTGLNTVQLCIPPAPQLASAERAGEAVELYWQSLLRDVPFHEFKNDTGQPDVLAAVAELNRLSAYHGPRAGGRITPETLFRGTALYVDKSDASGRTGRPVTPVGTLSGPYISQFLLRDAPLGTQSISARIRTALPVNDYLTGYDEWLTVQNGNLSGKSTKFDPTPRYIATGRDLAEYVHNNPAAFTVAAALLGTPAGQGGFGAPLNPANPYLKSKTQTGATSSFGAPYLQGLLPLATSRAIRATYWQKFYVHRVLRAEAYGGLVHHRVAGKVDDYPIHAELLDSQALDRSRAKFGSHLLAQVFPEGAPLHSAYPGGATEIAAANVTLLKAFFDESFVIQNPVQPDPADPTRLIPYVGPPLTVGGELNKLALNYGLGRNWAGIHWRSDFAASLAQGEDVAISLLRDERGTFREKFEGYTFSRFDGSSVTA